MVDLKQNLIRAIHEQLHDETVDVAKLFSDGELKWVPRSDIPAGYQAIIKSSAQPEVLVLASRTWNIYLGGKDTYDEIIAEPSRDIGGYSRLRRRYREKFVELNSNPIKYQALNPRQHFGRIVTSRAYLGEFIPTTLELAEPVYRAMLNAEVRTHMPKACDAIIEIGCGPGFQLCDLYFELGCPDLPFYGCELQRWSNASLVELAKMLGINGRIRAVNFDIDTANFSFASSCNVPLFFSVGALAYAQPSVELFFKRLAAQFPKFSFLLFEPISYELAEYFQIEPLFSRHQAVSNMFNLNQFAILKSLEKQGLLKVVEVFPDFIGATQYLSLSLLRIESVLR